METYFKIAAMSMLALILGLTLPKEFSALVSIAVCAMGLTVAIDFLGPVIQLLEQLKTVSRIPDTYFSILMKSMGIGLISEILFVICADAGNGALAKSLRLLSCLIILWLSIPLFEALLSMIQEILKCV